MNYKSTLALFVIMVAVVAAAIILPKHFKSTDDLKVSADKVFKDFDTKKATRMELTRGTLHVVCEKKDDTWFLTTPMKDRADKDKVESVLSACEFLRHKGTVSIAGGKADPAKYGLDKPQSEVTFTDPAGSKTLIIGGAFEAVDEMASSGSKNLYVQVKGSDTIYCVGDDILKDVDRQVVDFRSRKPFELLSHRVNKIELANASGTVSLAKGGEQWNLDKPVADKADGSKVSDIISAVSGAEKQDFTADAVNDLAKYGLGKPAASVKFWCDEEKGTKALLLGNAAPGDDVVKLKDDPMPQDQAGKVYACVEGDTSVFTLKSDIVEKLSPKANALRDRTMMTLKADDLTAIKLTGATGTIALEKAGAEWKMSEPKKVNADFAAVTDLAKLLEETKIDDWIDQPGDLAKYGLDKPVTLVLTQKKDEKKLELLAGKKEGDAAYVKLADKPWVMKVAGKLADVAGKDYLAYRTKRMMEFPKPKARKLNVARKDGILFIASSTDETRWSISKPVPGEADTANVTNILWNLCSLDAEKIVAEETKDLAQYGLDNPDIAATATVSTDEKDKDKTYTLQIGKKAGDDPAAGFYAMAEGQTMIFVVPKSVVDNLNNNLLSLGVMKFEKDDAVNLTIARGSDQIVCERKDKAADWQITTPAGQKADTGKIQEVVDALHLLRAMEYSEYEPKDLAKYALDKPATIITVEVKNDQNKVLHVGKKLDNGNAYALATDATPVFVLNKFNLEQIDKTLAGLLVDEKKEEKTDAANPAEPEADQPKAEAEPAEAK